MITYSSSVGIRAPLSAKNLDRLAEAVARVTPVLRRGVEVAFISPAEIRKLNRLHRGKDRPTDVLSFSFAHAVSKKAVPGFDLVGQMYLSPSVIKDQARRFKTTFKVEFARMFIHGLLHCAGLDHHEVVEARAMFAIQERILRVVGPKIGLPSTRIPSHLNDDYFKQSFVFPES